MKEILKLGGILFLITAVCTGLVAFANEITKAPIAAKEMEIKEDAMKKVMPEADDFEEMQKSQEIEEAYLAIKGGQAIGYAVSVAPKGYGGPINMMVGITKDGVVEGVEVLSHAETPGLGDNVTAPEFTNQFKDKTLAINIIKGGSAAEDEISAITGATITSESVTHGVNMALEYVASQEGVTQ